MILDARTVPTGTVIETEVCIIGAGAAGITLAREFRESPFRVALLESGGLHFDVATQELYDGQSIGRPFPDMMSDRLRFFGGTTNHWGGWCLPLDAIDFAPRDDLPDHNGWPFGKANLDPWYRRAHVICRLGPYDYRPADWGIAATGIPAPFNGPDFECKILQVSAVRFGPVYGPALRAAPRVTVYLHANAFDLDGGENDAEIRQLTVKTMAGTQFTVRARLYILAAGGIENARLLLASGRPDRNGLGNPRDLVGRYFMTHLVYTGGMIVPTDPLMNFDFRTNAYHSLDGSHHFVSMLGLSAAAMKQRRLPNMLVNWLYEFEPVAESIRALARLLHGEETGSSVMTDLSAVFRHVEGVADYAMRKMLFRHQGIPVKALHVNCTAEQQPNPQSRITLGTKRDALGMPETVVDWQPTAQDRAFGAATVRLLGQEIGRAGFGRLRSSFAESGAWPDDFYGNEHHMGTTRMHRDPTLGVVDENCRMHAVANLYVAGSSVFPTSGANNPTLTIVALALRLADRVKMLLA
jgi:choline dehydrogenase-like flavoprotein